MEKKLKLNKEVVENLSSDDLEQVQGGNDQNKMSDACSLACSKVNCKEQYSVGEYCLR